ncbi:DUF2267 domain-containing protein [Aureimonas ureilytica]|uniref:DUF2267 domain-containing protein n=1 Tax=Aureimonas ureilytica TaxID=401562 RepID=UPI003CFB9C0D
MSELTDRISAAASLTPEAAEQAIGNILAFLRSESDDPSVETVIAGTPGASDALRSAGDPEFGGGIMALGGKLMGLGLDMGQIRTVGEEFVAFAKLHTDEATVTRALGSVPALAPFV